MSLTVRELGMWDGTVVLVLDGATGLPGRPAIHLQAAAGGYVRLTGPHGPVLWGLVDPGWYAVDLVRASHGALEVLPPYRSLDIERDLGGWIRRFAALLASATATPIASGRRYLLASLDSVASAPRAEQHAWPRPDLRPERLDDIREQNAAFELSWEGSYLGLLLLRELSDESDGRVKAWRKRARDGSLPPVLVWWCRGLFTHVVLDGHDRLHAALLEGVRPPVVVLADATAASDDEVAELRQQSMDHAGLLDGVASARDRAAVVNAVLRSAWDPRREWTLATPGFPLDGGVAEWAQEVRGTMLDEVLRRRAT